MFFHTFGQSLEQDSLLFGSIFSLTPHPSAPLSTVVRFLVSVHVFPWFRADCKLDLNFPFIPPSQNSLTQKISPPQILALRSTDPFLAPLTVLVIELGLATPLR